MPYFSMRCVVYGNRTYFAVRPSILKINIPRSSIGTGEDPLLLIMTLVRGEFPGGRGKIAEEIQIEDKNGCTCWLST